MGSNKAFRYGRDHEVVQRLRPEPITEREIRAQEQVGDLDFEIFRHKVDKVALEGKETTMKLGASTGMRWGDVAFGIYTAEGDLAVCATGIYFHAVLSQIPVKYLVKHLRNEPTVGLKEGDAFFFNDPFYGGAHNADMGLVVPVFADGEVVCYVGAAVHSGECGGSEPGGIVCGAHTRYDEGMLVTPIKIGENFALKEDLLAMLCNMTRDPRTMMLDIKARLAASRIAERRVKEIVADKGADFFVGALRRILTVTAEAARKKLALVNDGIYRQPRFMDTNGPESALLKINVVLEKRGDRLKFILHGSSPLLRDRPVNSYFQGLIGLGMVYFIGWFFHELPANNGLLECMDWEFPEDSFVNAQGDVPVSMAPTTQIAFNQGVLMCGARMVYSLEPGKAVAPWFYGFSSTQYGGLNQYGDPIADITAEVNGGGAGARGDRDGTDAAGAFFATMSDCGDIESTESDRPFLYTFRNMYNNSYGHGKYRGGAGIGYGVMVHGTQGLTIAAMGTGSHFPSTLGIFGGRGLSTLFIKAVHDSNLSELFRNNSAVRPTTMAQVYDGATREQGEAEYLNQSIRPSQYAEGDTYYSVVGGGGGYGDVLERDPAAVMRDLRDGLTSHRAARDVYRVAYDADTLVLDRAGTERARQLIRQERKARAKPYKEFIKQWEQRRPAPEILTYYGNYPLVEAPAKAA